jgi:hypothetical protein
MDCVSTAWDSHFIGQNEATVLTRKLKFLRQALKRWNTDLSKIKQSIAKCNIVILFFDNLEEERGLFIAEENLRKIVKIHYDVLLHSQFLYWKKRCTARWMKLGEENTKYFNSIVTIRHMRNNVVSLTAEDGRIVTDHKEMAALSLNCYKNIMGTSRKIDMCLDLHALIKKVDGLEILTIPFTKDEMDNVIAKMPPDKAPGPDGFNGLFLKKCWEIVKENFYRLAEEFSQGRLNLDPFNTSYITLVPKC